jgi:hypothetical protein
VSLESAQLIAALALAALFGAYADVILGACRRIARATRMFPDLEMTSRDFRLRPVLMHFISRLGWKRHPFTPGSEAERNPPNVRHVLVWRGPPLEPTRAYQGVALLMTATAAVVVSVCALLSLVPHTTSGAVITTGANETTTEQLPDGSVLALGARSKVKVHVYDQQCVASFIAGEGRFSVARNLSKPLVVETFLAKATAPAGASFRVTIDTSVEFEVYEGAVQVYSRAAKSADPVITVRKGSAYRVPVVRAASAYSNDEFRIRDGAGG